MSDAAQATFQTPIEQQPRTPVVIFDEFLVALPEVFG